METAGIDYKYSSRLLYKINSLHVGDKLLPNTFFYEGYNLWQFHQEKIFGEIKEFSRTRRYTYIKKPSLLISLKEVVVNFLVVSITTLALLIIILGRKRVLVYAIDRTNSIFKSDVRLETLYEVFHNKNIKYAEIFHTVLGRDTLLNFLKRKRPALYLESLYILFRIASSLGLIKSINTDFVSTVDLSSFDGNEKIFVKDLLIRYSLKIQMSQFSITTLRKALSLTRITTLFSIEDPRSYNEIIVACKLEGISTHAIQHGHFSEYHIGWRKDDRFDGKMPVPDILFVWSRYWKDELKRLNGIFPSEQVIVGGIKREEVKTYEWRGDDSDWLTVLVPYEAEAPKHEVTQYIKKILECDNTRVIFKLRTGVSKEQQLNEYNLADGLHKRFSTTFDIEAVIQEVDIVAGVYSTLLYDALTYPKRVVVFETSSDYGRGIITNDLANLLKVTNVCKQLEEIRSIPESLIVLRKDKLYDAEPIFLEDTVLNIIKKENLL